MGVLIAGPVIPIVVLVIVVIVVFAIWRGTMFIELLKNQVAQIMILFTVIAVGSFIVISDPVIIKDILTILIAAGSGIVTGQQMERKRATDLPPNTTTTQTVTETSKVDAKE